MYRSRKSRLESNNHLFFALTASVLYSGMTCTHQKLRVVHSLFISFPYILLVCYTAVPLRERLQGWATCSGSVLKSPSSWRWQVWPVDQWMIKLQPLYDKRVCAKLQLPNSSKFIQIPHDFTWFHMIPLVPPSLSITFVLTLCCRCLVQPSRARAMVLALSVAAEIIMANCWWQSYRIITIIIINNK